MFRNWITYCYICSVCDRLVNNTESVASNDIVISDLEETWKGAVVAWFKELYSYFPERIEENNEDRQCVFGVRTYIFSWAPFT